MKTYKDAEAFALDEMSDKGLGDQTIQILHETEVTYHYSSGIHSSPWTQYFLSGFPGCCGILVSHGSWLAEKFRGFGLGDYFHKERLRLAKEMGYSCITCTTISSNKTEIAILTKNNWKKVHEFVNSRTGNTVHIWVKDI